ncbi:sensor histidine kinase [Paracoccus panacisoli]|uniref:histidine kinase n=1 Tax=Paracoccus panacisoli TaxID=1510163 RepID=A0ABV6T835_9RHOB
MPHASAPPRAPAGYSLTRRLSLRVLALTGAGWLLAVAVAIAVLDHETGETLDDALGREAQLLAAMAANGAALPALPSDDRILALIPPSSSCANIPGSGAAPRPAGPPAPPWPPAPSPATPPATAPGKAEITRRGGWVVAGVTLQDGRRLELGEPLALRRHELIESLRGLLAAMLPVALALMWVVRRTLGQALRPVAALSATLSGRDAADLAPLDSAGLPAELAPVAANLNRYLARIQGLMTAERDFAAHAAHELRTPVAAARAEAQLLARRPEVAADAGRIVAALDRITALTERLLQLSRAESGIGLARGPVDLAALVPMALDDLPVLPGRPLGYDDGDLETAVVEGDADGIAILIRNLAENALRHGTGPVRVTLAAGPRLTVTNPVGPGARFRMGRLDRDPASEGTGLGLTIAAKLAEQSGARLTTGIAGGVATAVLDWSR